jgi:hypothetical protein
MQMCLLQHAMGYSSAKRQQETQNNSSDHSAVFPFFFLDLFDPVPFVCEIGCKGPKKGFNHDKIINIGI